MSSLVAVLLAAGPGSRMVELTKERPKCLLPIGNHCLIWFAITNLRYAGIHKIICLVPDTYENEIKQYCYKKFNSFKDISIEFAPVKTDNDCGTAESILSIKELINSDFIVYSCDSIISPKSLTALVNHYRLYDSTLTMLFSDNPKYFNLNEVPGKHHKEKVLKDIIAIESLDDSDRECNGFVENKVVFMYSERDLKSKLKIRSRELALHPSIQVYSCYLDSHVYILKRSVIDFMQEHSDRVVLKGEIIPLLISKQFSGRTKKGNTSNLEDDDDDVHIGFNNKTFDYEIELQQKLEAFHPQNVVDAVYFQRKASRIPTITCHALVTADDSMTYRVNTIGSFVNCNKNAKNLLREYGLKQINSIKDCIVGDNTQVGEKCVLKRSCIGSNCKIGDKVKLIDSVILDNVEIESNTTLTETIVGSNLKIGSKCDLKLCIVGSKQSIPPGRKSKCEVIDEGYSIDLTEIMFE